MTTHQNGFGPETMLKANAVYTRWRELIEHEHLTEDDAELRVAEDLRLSAEHVEEGIFAGQLTESEIRYRIAARKYESERGERNAMVQRALQRGWTHSQIAGATALTRSRVGQIALWLEAREEV